MGRRQDALKDGFGDRLKRARQALGLRQVELGDIVGLREFTLSRYENEVNRPDRCFLAGLEYLTGIQRAWIERGVEPMIRPPATTSQVGQALLDRLEEELAGTNGSLVPYPPSSGMTGMAIGDFLLVQGGETALQEGRVFLVESTDGQRTAGIARRSPHGWLIYHDQDAEAPGTYPPTPANGTTGVMVKAKIHMV